MTKVVILDNSSPERFKESLETLRSESKAETRETLKRFPVLIQAFLIGAKEAWLGKGLDTSKIYFETPEGDPRTWTIDFALSYRDSVSPKVVSKSIPLSQLKYGTVEMFTRFGRELGDKFVNTLIKGH